ncbi:AlpA family transcriptional regulator [Rhizorhabdus sp.]|uniref:helix-turn-helix transcriptional regulator n=1 Tax=Rhizorhabdus sp. TaxID=1968843 RepID=UPI0019C91AE2|nr:AlpA family phage regulatory protein [Rhizorhabdus sp.]MBD3762597.1 AlpA family phage regulatory protein [Rhizorhabdus sp.]
MSNDNPAPVPDDEDLLTIADITERTKKNRATIYRWIKGGLFPPGRMTGPNSRQWTRREYRNWLESRAA